MSLSSDVGKPARPPAKKPARRAAVPRVEAAVDAGRSEAPRIAPEERRALIAQAAYFRAERRGFAPGGEDADWLAAEAEVDAALAAAATAVPPAPRAPRRAVRSAPGKASS